MSSALVGLDRKRFPSVASYLERLPSGLLSYPDCQGKASLLRSMMDELPVARIASGMPSVLADLVLHPPPSGAWIPEVQFRAIMRAVLDEFFRDPVAFVAWTYGAQQQLLGGPLYRVMFALLNPERMIKLAQSRWGSFHRGTLLHIEGAQGQGTATLTYPAHSYELLDHDATMAGFRVAIELTGGRMVECTVLEVGVTQSRSRISWR